MKTIYLVRHAKSSWGVASIADIDRPLNERGYTDAYEMAKRLQKKSIIAHIVSSPATRAISTALIFARVCNADVKKIDICDLLYESDIKRYTSVLSALSDEHSTVLLFGHNPIITEFANFFGGCGIESMPTCGIVGIEFNEISWKSAGSAKGKMVLYDFPKNTTLPFVK